MKTKLLLSLLCIISVTAPATDIKVSPETFKAAYQEADDGDVLLLSEGTYATEMTFPTGKTITLKADTGASPVLTANVRCKDENCNNGQLIFDGLNINHNSGDNYLMNFDNIGNIKGIVCRNCEIQNIGRCFLRTNNSGHIELMEFDNCIIHDNGLNAWNFIYPKHTVGKLVVTNTTFYNYASGESFFSANSENDGGTPIDATIQNCTFYNWGKDSNRAILNLGTKYSGESKFAIKDNIFAEPDGNPQPNIITCTGGELTALNNLCVNVGTYNLKNGKKTVEDLSLEQLGLATIGFPDPQNGDFSILSSSPLATAGTKGQPVGDGRWIKSLQNGVHVTTTSMPTEGGKTTPAATDIEKGSAITLLATPNYGYEFSKWQYKSGDDLTTDNPATVTITSDQDFVAVFNKLPMYTLTVEKEGEGAKWGDVSITPTFEDNTYVEGTKVSATIVENPVTSFLKWEDTTTDATRTFFMDEDKNITATFDVIPFIVGWDFSSGKRDNAPAEYHFTTDNTGIMNLYDANGTVTSWGASEKSFGGRTLQCARRYTEAADLKTAPRYFEAKFSAKGYTNIHVTSKIGLDNECVLANQKLQYSTDGTKFNDLAEVDVIGQVNTDWIDLGGFLPDLTDKEKETIYLRWIGDAESDPLTDSPTGSEGLYLASVFVYADKEAVEDHEAPILLYTEPTEGSATASASGNVILYFNEKVKAGEGNATLNGQALTAVFGSKTAAFSYKGLEYGKEYEFNLPAGALTDTQGNVFGGKVIRFTTMSRPQPTPRKYDVVVASDGSGDVKSVQEAIDKCPTNNASPWLVYIKNGTYNDIVRIPENKPFIHLIGQDKERTILTFKIHSATDDSDTKYTPAALGVTGDYVTEISSHDFYAENISFENAWGVEMQAGPMALAVKNHADRAAFYNCRFRSYQDTWYVNMKSPSNRTYANHCFIEGAVDYFYGDGNAYIENTEFHNRRSGSIITAPSHKNGTEWGFVFVNDTITAIPEARDGKLKLGRPWQNKPIAVWINTTMVAPVAPEGWTDMGVIPALFAEYNSMDADGNAVDLSHRKSSYHDRNTGLDGTCQNTLSAEEAARYTYKNVVGGSDDWNPRKYFEAVDAPANVMATPTTIVWGKSPYAICYLVFKDGEMIDQTTDCAYYVPCTQEENITVCAVNEYGHQSLHAKATFSPTDGLSNMTAKKLVETKAYDTKGRPTQNGKKGVSIIVSNDTNGHTKVSKRIGR